MLKIISLLFLLGCVVQFSFSQTDSLVENGREKQKEGKHEAAIIDFSDVLHKYDPEVHQFLKKCEEYQKLSDFDRAEREIEAPSMDIAVAFLYYLRGLSYAAIGKNDETMSDFNTAIKINPKLREVYYHRGKLLFSNGKKYEGCVELTMAVSLGDSLAKDLFDEKDCLNDAVAAYHEASSQLKRNQYHLAFDLIEKSIKLCPDSGSYLTVRGNCYFGMGKIDLSFYDFDKAIALSTNNVDALFSRGVAFFNMGKYPESFNDLDKAIRLNPKFIDAYLYRAYACEGMGKNESALYDYRQVQRMKPKDPFAYYKSGLLRNEMNDKKGSCKDFRKAASLGSAEAAAYVKSCK